MGLDLILGALVILAALRGWFQGFVMQAVRLGGLIGCVYEAGPVRDAVRPHIAGYLTGIRPDLLDRLLWWASAILAYVVTVGLATWLVRVYRRRPYGEPDLYRGNQAAGFLLGGAKGLLVAALVAGGIDHFVLSRIKGMGWAEQQASASYSLTWTQKYHPLARIWAAAPVQTFVAHVQRMGLNPPQGTAAQTPAGRPPAPAEPAPTDPVRTASRPDPLELPHGPPPAPDPVRKDLHELDAAIESIGKELGQSPNN